MEAAAAQKHIGCLRNALSEATREIVRCCCDITRLKNAQAAAQTICAR